MDKYRRLIEAAWDDRSLLNDFAVVAGIENVIELLDKGELRVASKEENGWQVNEWIKKAVILYFPTRKMETIEVGPVEFHDKIPLKKNYKKLGIRVVPHAIARYGAYISSGVIMISRILLFMALAMVAIPIPKAEKDTWKLYLLILVPLMEKLPHSLVDIMPWIAIRDGKGLKKLMIYW